MDKADYDHYITWIKEIDDQILRELKERLSRSLLKSRHIETELNKLIEELKDDFADERRFQRIEKSKFEEKYESTNHQFTESLNETMKVVKRNFNTVAAKHKLNSTTSSESFESSEYLDSKQIPFVKEYLSPQRLLGRTIGKIKDSVFVIMPMNKDAYPEWEKVYKIIQDECGKLGLVAKHVKDSSVGSPKTDHEILINIDLADFLIVDLTMARPNVYFELGYSYGDFPSDKFLLIAKKKTKIHFDVLVDQTESYEEDLSNLHEIIYQNIEKMKNLRDAKLKQLKSD